MKKINKNGYTNNVIIDTSFNLFNANKLAKYIAIDCETTAKMLAKYVLDG